MQPAEHFGKQAVVVLLEVFHAVVRDADRGLEQVDLLASPLRRADGRGVGSDGERHQDGNDGQHSAAGRLHVCNCTACRLAATEDFCFARLGYGGELGHFYRVPVPISYVQIREFELFHKLIEDHS